ncbi:hypothetical protein D3C84_1236610 [compost metagenome]
MDSIIAAHLGIFNERFRASNGHQATIRERLPTEQNCHGAGGNQPCCIDGSVREQTILIECGKRQENIVERKNSNEI